MPTFSDARDRREVLLSDGRIGRLQHISRNSRIATVVIGGRRYRLPVGQIRTFWVHHPPVDGILPCCSKEVSWIPPEDRISPIPEAVTCSGYRPAAPETPLEAVLSASKPDPEGSVDPDDLRNLERIYWERLDQEIREAQNRDLKVHPTTTEGAS